MSKTMTPREPVEAYLRDLAGRDENFRAHYTDGVHTIEGALAYCDFRGLKQAKEQAEKRHANTCICLTDAEVHGWAVHYYTEPVETTTAEMEADKPKDPAPKAKAPDLFSIQQTPAKKTAPSKSSKPTALPVFEAVKPSTPTTPTESKKTYTQLSLFDF